MILITCMLAMYGYGVKNLAVNHPGDHERSVSSSTPTVQCSTKHQTCLTHLAQLMDFSNIQRVWCERPLSGDFCLCNLRLSLDWTKIRFKKRKRVSQPCGQDCRSATNWRIRQNYLIQVVPEPSLMKYSQSWEFPLPSFSQNLHHKGRLAR